VLSRVFRGKFIAALQHNFRQGKLGFHGPLKPLAHPKAFSAWLRTLFRHDWHVYSKRPFGGAEQALRYLGHYTHRVAISNHRLVSLIDHQVTFRGRDSAHHNEPKLMSLALDEFLGRFLLHLLPKGFVRIRHFGFLANRRRATLLPICLSSTRPNTAADRTTTLPGSASPPALALSPMWRSHGGHRETYRCPAPTSCSTLSRRSRRMKLQSQAPSLGALTPCRRCVHSCPQTSCPFPTSTQNPVPATCKLQRDPPCFRFFELHHIFPKPLPQTQHH
jgi:hypothetical protein